MATDGYGLAYGKVSELKTAIAGTKANTDYEIFFDSSTNRLMKYAAGAGARKIAKIAFGATELGGSETNTTFTFPSSGAIVHNCYIYVSDAEGGGSMDVGTQGTSNDPDGLLDGISLASTGWVFPNITTTVGLNETYVSAMTYGALWMGIITGTDVAGDTGFVYPKSTFITAADPVSITSSGDLNSCSGFLFIEYTELPVVA